MNLIDLIQRSQRDDRLAQRELYYAYKDSLYTLVVRILNDKDQAKDILQETFIDAFRGIQKLEEPAYFYSWIRQILVRKAYKSNRDSKHLKFVESIEDEMLTTDAPADTGYIEAAIAQLPLRSRIVFMMIEVEGFSHKEVAETLDISLGTSKSQLHYAKSKLKQRLKKYYNR